MTCRLCGGETTPLFERDVLGKHRVAYHQCPVCGLTQTDTPTWLEEAYVDAIHPTDTGVLAISGANDPSVMYELSRIEVHGFVQRTESIEILEEAMLEVGNRKRYLPAAFQRNREAFERTFRKTQSLTPCERLLLRKVASGMTSRLIALEMNLSPRTVETYRSRLMKKLHVPNTAALIDYAFRKGFVGEQRGREPGETCGIFQAQSSDERRFEP